MVVSMTNVRMVRAGVLDVGYERHGAPDGWPVVLLHGFPYDVRCYDAVARRLADEGADVVVPYLRGYGPTRFADAATMRSGQQAALAHDLHELIAALALRSPLVAGYDWGGRAACLVAALWPGQVGGLATCAGYNVQDIAAFAVPEPPHVERRLWYQYYLHGERGRAGLEAHRAEYARQLWGEWSPTWGFTDADFEATVGSFDNPDFVEVVVHSYRHRYGLVPGDPAYQATEDVIAGSPRIGVPTVVLDPVDDTIDVPSRTDEHQRHFARLVDHRLVPGGHDVPQESPDEFAAALLSLRTATRPR